MTNLLHPDHTGNLEIWLKCPAPNCDFEGLVYYTTRQPKFCSNACRQRDYRDRKKAATLTSMPSLKAFYDEYDPNLSFLSPKVKSELENILVTCGQEAVTLAIELSKTIAASYETKLNEVRYKKGYL